MTIDDKLIPQTMKEQCDSAIRILEEDNRNIKIAQKCLEQFIVDDELMSEAYSMLKMQIADYLTLTLAMISANDLDIADLRKLKDAVGEEELHGDVIAAYKNSAITDMNTFSDKAVTYARQAGSMPAMSPMQTWYKEAALFYETRGILAGKKYDSYLQMEQKFDEIEAATRNLFTQSRALRYVVKQGMEYVNGAFRDGVYHIDVDAPWREELAMEKDSIIQGIKATFMTTNACGEPEYDWVRISAWLEGDADAVPELEYLAFAGLMSEMSESDLQTLFSSAQIMDSPKDMVYCEVSSVMKTAAERYRMLTEIEAEFTIFDTHSGYSYDEVSVINELSRAVFISQVTTVMDTGKYHDICVSMDTAENGKITYTADMTVKTEANMNPYDAEQWGRVLVSEQEKKTIVVNPWGTPLTAGAYLDNNVKTTLISLDGSVGETIGKVGVDNVADYIFSKLGEGTAEAIGSGLSNSLTLLEFAQDMKRGYENFVAIDGAMNSLDTRQAIVALGINTGMVNVTGPTENSIGFVCPKYDPEELLVRVAVYNNENETSITVEELKESFENNGEVFTDYMEWYYGDGNGDVEEYWDELQEIMLNYYDKNPEIPQKTTGNLTTEQLQELINKYNDPNYEINAEIMGEQE